MGEELLVNETITAGADFVLDFHDYMPVSVACWVIHAESDDVFLYIASDNITDENFDVAYREVLRKLSGNQWLDPFQIKLVNSSDPIAQDAIEIPKSPNGTASYALRWLIDWWNEYRLCLYLPAGIGDKGNVIGKATVHINAVHRSTRSAVS